MSLVTGGVSSMKEKLAIYAGIIVGDGSWYGKIKTAIEDLHKLFVAAGGLNAYTPTDRGTSSETGEAVSPVTAALCAFDLARTRKFVRGLIGALKEQSAKRKPVQVLYAGSGPYALLALLATPYFDASEVQFTVIDIHDESVGSVKKNLETFGVGDYFAGIEKADATLFEWKKNKPLDILLTETMQNGLRNEQQVSIAAQLVPMLAEEGVMIPQEIEIRPVFVDLKLRHEIMMGAVPEQDHEAFIYERIAVLNRSTALTAAGNIQQPFPDSSILLKEEFLKIEYDLELRTKITIWKGEILEGFDSSLSLPVPVSNGAALEGKKGIHFRYENHSKPGFRWDYF